MLFAEKVLHILEHHRPEPLSEEPMTELERMEHVWIGRSGA